MILRSLLMVLLLAGAVQAEMADTLISHLRFRLGQTTASNSNWTDAELMSVLNMSQKWISAQGRVIEKSGWLAGGSPQLGLPALFIKMRGTALLWRNGVAVKPIPLTSLDSLPSLLDRISERSSGRDVHYMVESGDSVLVTPTVNSADSVQIFYYAHADTLATTVECSYGDEWEQVLVLTAKVIALEKNRDPTVSFWTQERDKLLAAMYQQKTLKPQLVDVP